jgi:hypothetical protein
MESMEHFRKRELGYRSRKIEFVKWKLERTRNIKISGRKKQHWKARVKMDKKREKEDRK